jgi:hypothetical protein
MEDDRKHQESQDIIKLRVMVSRLHAMSVANVQTVINLSSALTQIPDLPEPVRAEGRAALDSIQKQIDILNELADIAGTNNGR